MVELTILLILQMGYMMTFCLDQQRLMLFQSHNIRFSITNHCLHYPWLIFPDWCQIKWNDPGNIAGRIDCFSVQVRGTDSAIPSAIDPGL